jgi:hypothetical protein
LVALWRCPTLASAFRLERRLKRLPRKIKHRLAGGRWTPEGLPDLFRGAVAARMRRTR